AGATPTWTPPATTSPSTVTFRPRRQSSGDRRQRADAEPDRAAPASGRRGDRAPAHRHGSRDPPRHRRRPPQGRPGAPAAGARRPPPPRSRPAARRGSRGGGPMKKVLIADYAWPTLDVERERLA